jgi:hypothetical protein
VDSEPAYNPPYHLRPNKAAARQAFVAALRKLEIALKLDFGTYTYCGLGGPFLEDFRLMYREWPDMSLVSFENNEHTYRRQVFHRFQRKLDLRRADFDAGILEAGKDYIVWLDFTQLTNVEVDIFSQCLQKVGTKSIVKMTVPLGWSGKRKPPFLTLPTEEKARKRTIEEELEYIARFRVEFGDAPTSLPREKFEPKNLPGLLMEIFELVAQRAIPATDSIVYQPFFASHYVDSQPLIEIAGMVVDKDAAATIRSSLANVEYCRTAWGEMTDIRLPELTAKERMRLEEMLPQENVSAEALVELLGYHIDEPQHSIRQLECYSRLHKFTPLFLKFQT